VVTSIDTLIPEPRKRLVAYLKRLNLKSQNDLRFVLKRPVNKGYVLRRTGSVGRWNYALEVLLNVSKVTVCSSLIGDHVLYSERI
jgi:hypothetical protein